MTDLNEELLNAAKLREQVRGSLEGEDVLHEHTGLVAARGDRASISFLEAVDTWHDSELADVVLSSIASDVATEAVHAGDSTVLAHLTGVTEQDLDGRSLRLPLRLLDELDNNGAPAFVLGAGNPETGKTNTMSLLAELRRLDRDELLIVSNVRNWELADHVVTSAHDLLVTLLEHRDRPKFVLIDEGSTHFDARTYRREVATQFTPMAKRFAKIGVDVFGTVGHTGKDLHPEVKRLATLAFFKTEKTTAEFFDAWDAEADYPADRLFGGDVSELEATGAEYDPDDAAPWAWNLEPELFALDLDWSELLEELRSRGSA